MPLNARAVIGCVVAAAATASGMFYGVVYNPVIGGVIGVVCAMGVLVIAGRFFSPFSIIHGLVAGAAAVLLGSIAGRIYFHHRIIEQIPRLATVVRKLELEPRGVSIDLRAEQLWLVDSATLHDEPSRRAVFMLRNGTAVAYVPNSRDWPHWREDSCPFELGEGWFILARCVTHIGAHRAHANGS